MSSCKISDDVYSVGILNPGMRIFDVVMRTEYGTSYNSFLVKGAEKTALIEVSHAAFFDPYLSNIQEVCDPESIDYIILNHCEPDHSGALAALLARCPNATVVVSRAGSIYLKNITNLPGLRLQVAKDGDVLDLGGRTLKFIHAPFLHWPDSMFTWLAEEQTLFTCDFLGCHYCEPYTFDYRISHPAAYEQSFREYYDAIFAPFRPYVVAGLEKVRALEPALICTSHGPVLTKENRIGFAMERYTQWSAPEEPSGRSIPVFYCSAYGNTEKIAAAIRDGIREVLPDADTAIYDINQYDMHTLRSVLNRSAAFAIGSPTINADAVAPVWNLLSHVDAINIRKRPALVFGSYGWSGEAVPNLIARLNGLKCSVFGEGFRVLFVPCEQDLENAKGLGRAFARSLQPA